MLLGPSAAFADEPSDARPSSDLVVTESADEIPEGATTVQAVLACDEFTGDVLAYAQEHGHCPIPSEGGVTPQAVQTFNCGSAWIYGFNNGIRGRMYVSYGFSSTQGVVVHRNLAIGTSLGIGWNDNLWMWSSYYDSGSRYVGWVLWAGTQLRTRGPSTWFGVDGAPFPRSPTTSRSDFVVGDVEDEVVDPM